MVISGENEYRIEILFVTNAIQKHLKYGQLDSKNAIIKAIFKQNVLPWGDTILAGGCENGKK